jgi:hypothetical protein
MIYARYELCRELYELSGWKVGAFEYYTPEGTIYSMLVGKPKSTYVPAYDLGFLMRKLPDGYGLVKIKIDHWVVFEVSTMQPQNGERAASPEDVAAALCIKLWKQGILTS